MNRFVKIILLAILFAGNANGGDVTKIKNAGKTKDIILIKDDNSGTPELIKRYVQELGYTVDVIAPIDASPDLLAAYRLTILSAGPNPNACNIPEVRLAIQSHILNSGKVIIEGGHLGYIAAVFPFYLGFRNKVMMIDDWITDQGGDLVISGDHSASNLAAVPNQLPQTIHLNYSTINDQDICTNNKFSELFYKTALYNDKVGILVAPAVDNPQVINYFINFAAIANQVDAKHLLENSIYNLIGKPVGINNNGGNVPDKYNLYQNYPNPFNPSTSIHFDLAKNSIAVLKIYNALGIEIATVVNEKLAAGSYNVNFNANNYPTGIYYYNLSIDGVLFESRKMILLK